MIQVALPGAFIFPSFRQEENDQGLQIETNQRHMKDPQIKRIEIPNNEPVQRVDQDLCCVGCGYNLKSLQVGSMCPECGLPVRRSMPLSELAGSDAWFKSVRRGTLTLLVLCCSLLGLLYAALVIAIFPIALNKSIRIPFSFGTQVALLIMTIMVTCGAGCLWLTRPNGDPRLVRSRVRVLARYWVLVLVAIGVVPVVTSQRLHADVLLAVSFILWTLWISLYVHRLAVIAHDGILRRHANVWAFVIMVSILLFAGTYAIERYVVQVSPAVKPEWLKGVRLIFRIGMKYQPFIMILIIVIAAVTMDHLRKLLDRSVAARS